MLHSEAIATFNKLVELRRQRIERISPSVLGVLWAAPCLVGPYFTILFFYCFVVVSLRLYALLKGLLP